MRKIITLGLACALGMMLPTLSAWAQSPAAPAQTAMTAGAGPGSGAGPASTCLKCHGNEAAVTPILQTPHAVRGDKRTPFAQDGCESCHGDSSKHVASRANPPAIVFKGKNISPVAQRNEACLTCHTSTARMNWQGSAHEVNDKACTDCHTLHASKDPILVRATQSEKCFTCHVRQRNESLKFSHHPMREGKVICSDCHNPHGGSNEPRLMKERMQFLCSSCHSGTGNSHGGAFGGGGSIPNRGPGTNKTVSYLGNQRDCLNCHSQVHGSNSPAGAFFFR